MTSMKYILTGLLGIAICSSSCKKWLTVQPKTQMPADVLFSTESGFQDALTGVYIQMKSSGAYGQQMTFGTIERLTSSWDVTSNSTEQRLGLFNYGDEGVQGALSSVYGAEYGIIAGINAILGEVDAKRDVFQSEGSYEMMKGECLALRAYCHLDLLRLFGPVPGNIPGGTVLPYVTKISRVPNEHVSYEEYKAALLKDLAEAETLMKDVDPFIKYSQADLTNPGGSSSPFRPENSYSGWRYLRMNYYAVKALQARAYLWFSDNAAAYAAARTVIDAKNPDGNAKFRLGTLSDMSGGNLNLSVEHIFGLYDFQLETKYQANFVSGNFKKGSSVTTVRNQLYGNTGTDIREANLWELVTLLNGSKCYILKKYRASTDGSQVAPFQIPMLRIAEMYLIAAEAAPAGEGQQYWEAFRTARNIAVTTLPGDPVQAQLELVKEYRKEFFGEGQGFFAYKRIDAPKASFLWAPSAAVINYTPPLPLSEFIQ
ncbi:RagB/SusD family nutrient uptake outer membrane protein [Chitinophaga sp. GCM10012297]|uniref:RagB/SusD family nutrient uptake outer membrane protein n=1 Tax=Chitinophaga chungangae TaxID=2821488 RepID=A0ABS3YG22_9BACT|nr:RagB/SusD family nutrient uptake outer membrane protein [Chitinophaga chungangae]MBO9153632.1 RagB/SusD family nutrient uptake outer membrane protein [Chitinophaga chungangae]